MIRVLTFAFLGLVAFLAGYGFGALAMDVQISQASKRLREILADPAQQAGA